MLEVDTVGCMDTVQEMASSYVLTLLLHHAGRSWTGLHLLKQLVSCVIHLSSAFLT